MSRRAKIPATTGDRKLPTTLERASAALMVEDFEKLIFTAARDWHRSVRIDRQERDTIVKALRAYAALGSPVVAEPSNEESVVTRP